MKRVLKIVFSLLFLIIVTLGIFWFHSSRVENSGKNQTFLSGSVPKNMPDGFHAGSADFYMGSWKGKTFHAVSSTGTNVFETDEITEEKYMFSVTNTKGIQNTELDVIQINYDLPENPWWIRPLQDEITQVAPGEYVGKMYFRLIPGHPFSLGFFHLSKHEEVKNVLTTAEEFTVRLPQNWKIRFDDESGKRYNGLIAFSPNFQFKREQNPDATAGYDLIVYEYGAKVDIRKDPGEETAKKNPPGTILKEETKKVDGITGRYLTYQEPNTVNGTILGFRMVYKGNSYIFRFSYNPKTYPQGKERFDEILSSFHFKNQE